MVEKSIVAYGSVQMGLLEKGLSWISLFIALAPMLGFFGTVIGMIGAFDAIEAAIDFFADTNAGGIGVAHNGNLRIDSSDDSSSILQLHYL